MSLDAGSADEFAVRELLERIGIARWLGGQGELYIRAPAGKGGFRQLAIEGGRIGGGGIEVAVGFSGLAGGGRGASGPVFGARLADRRRDACLQLAEMAIGHVRLVQELKRDPARHEFGIGESTPSVRPLPAEIDRPACRGPRRALRAKCGARSAGFRADKLVRLGRRGQQQRQGVVVVAALARSGLLIEGRGRRAAQAALQRGTGAARTGNNSIRASASARFWPAARQWCAHRRCGAPTGAGKPVLCASVFMCWP